MEFVGRFIIMHLCLGFYLFTSYGIKTEEYMDWIMPNSKPPKTLYCPKYSCTSNPQWNTDSCCSCSGLTEWEYYAIAVGNLTIQTFENDTFHGAVVNPNAPHKYYQLLYNGRYLSEIPKNVCNFSRIVILEMVQNQIEEIPDLACLYLLDTLNVSWNNIRLLGNDTFKHNLNLRIVDLSFNLLFYIQPGFMAPRTIVTLNLSNNYFLQYDASNAGLMFRPFCNIDLSHNRLIVENITNESNITIDPSKTYGPGFVNFQYNKLQSITNLIDNLGLKNEDEIGALWDFGFDIRNNPIDCDCRLVPILEIFQRMMRFMDLSYYPYLSIICHEPMKMRGISLLDLTERGEFDKLTCKLSTFDKCPLGCNCYYRLSGENSKFVRTKKTVWVNCTSTGLTALPLRMPSGDVLKLHLAGNNIRILTPVGYLKRTDLLDLSENSLEKIDRRSVRLLLNISRIILKRNHHMKQLPKALIGLNPCRFKFPRVVLKCTCKNIWLKQWLKARTPLGKRHCNLKKFFCKENGVEIPIAKIDETETCKVEQNKYIHGLFFISVSGVSLSVLVIVALSCFRYETLFLIMRLKKYVHRTGNHTFRYDIYLSYNERRSDVRQWLIRDFLPQLSSEGFAAYLPELTMTPGTIRSEETLAVLSKCKSFVVILTDNYFEDDGILYTTFEWKSMCKAYFSNSSHNVIVVNFDLLDSSDIPNKQGKAYLRLGYDVEFHNQKRNLFKTVKYKLGAYRCMKTYRLNRYLALGTHGTQSDREEENEMTPLLQ